MNSGGRPRAQSVPRVPRSSYSWMSPGARQMLKMRNLLEGASTLNFAMQFLDPGVLQGAIDYGWDDFMMGDLPPPFDGLNTPREWLKLPPVNDGSVPEYPPFPVYGFDPSMVFPTPSDFHNPDQWVAVQVNSPGTHWQYKILPLSESNGRHIHADSSEIERDNNPFIHDPLIRPLNQWNGPNTYDTPSGPQYGYIHYWALAAAPHFNGDETVWDSRWGDWVFGATFIGGSTRPADISTDIRIGVGSTKDAALEDAGALKQGTVTFVPDFEALRWPNVLVPLRNLLGILNGTHEETGDVDPVNQGGTKTIGVPGGPVITVPTKPGEPAHPPGYGTKEKKARVSHGMFKIAQSLFHGITEYGDLVDAVFDAIPKAKRCKTKSLVGKSLCIATHLDDIDIGDAIVNIAWNEFEDRVIGRGFGLNQKAAQARGDPYGFRTLNSINGFGGVDELGELYGDFSKEYVNPRKQDLKDYLTRRFGI